MIEIEPTIAIKNAQREWGMALSECAAASQALAFAVLDHADKHHRGADGVLVAEQISVACRLGLLNARKEEKEAKARYLDAVQKGI